MHSFMTQACLLGRLSLEERKWMLSWVDAKHLQLLPPSFTKEPWVGMHVPFGIKGPSTVGFTKKYGEAIVLAVQEKPQQCPADAFSERFLQGTDPPDDPAHAPKKSLRDNIDAPLVADALSCSLLACCQALIRTFCAGQLASTAQAGASALTAEYSGLNLHNKVSRCPLHQSNRHLSPRSSRTGRRCLGLPDCCLGRQGRRGRRVNLRSNLSIPIVEPASL